MVIEVSVLWLSVLDTADKFGDNCCFNMFAAHNVSVLASPSLALRPRLDEILYLDYLFSLYFQP